MEKFMLLKELVKESCEKQKQHRFILRNGFQMRGVADGRFDDESFYLITDEIPYPQLVMFQAISTVA